MQQRALAKSVLSWRAFATRRASSRYKMRKVAQRIQNLRLSSALLGWRTSVDRNLRLRVVGQNACKRAQNAMLTATFATMKAYRGKKKRKKLDEQERAVVIDEMYDWNHQSAVKTCQRAIRSKQDAKRFREIFLEALRHQRESEALRSELAEVEWAQDEAISEATAHLRQQLVDQDEHFSVEMRAMQQHLTDAEKELAQHQQLKDATEQLHAQEAAKLDRMQVEQEQRHAESAANLDRTKLELLAQAEAVIEKEAAVATREANVSPAFAEAENAKEALAKERTERARVASKERVARQRLEQQLQEQAEREAALAKQVEALRSRVDEQQRQLTRQIRQAKKAAAATVDTTQDTRVTAAPRQQSPARPRRSSPQKKPKAKGGGPAAGAGPASWSSPFKPHTARSPLPLEERVAQGKAMLKSHGTAAARAAAAHPGNAVLKTRAEIDSLSEELAHAAEEKAQAEAKAQAEVERLAAKAAAEAEREKAHAEAERAAVEAAEAAAIESLQRGVQLNLFYASGKLKHGRFFWLDPAGMRSEEAAAAAATAAGQGAERVAAATLSWGKAARGESRKGQCKTEILRGVTDGPSISDAAELFNSMDKDHSGTLDASEISALYRQARGEKLSKKALSNALAVMDTDGSGSVDREEFLRWWQEDAASDLEKQADRAITVEIGGEGLEAAAAAAGDGSGGDGVMSLRLVAPSAEVKERVLLGLQAALRGTVAGEPSHDDL